MTFERRCKVYSFRRLVFLRRKCALDERADPLDTVAGVAGGGDEMKTCNQACPYNTLRGCVVDEHGGICILSNMLAAGCKPVTNADRIRGMSDEELAKFLHEPFCDKRTHEECTISYCGVCDQCVLDWLQQPAEEEPDVANV